MNCAPTTDDKARSVLVALRRVTQAVDTHSRRLTQTTGLSIPQILVLQALAACDQGVGTGELSRELNLTQGTVSSILDRLERKRLIARKRGLSDRRRVRITLTDAGRRTIAEAPPLLQAHFLDGFGRLPDIEQDHILETLRCVADLMGVEPLAAGQVAPSPPDSSED